MKHLWLLVEGKKTSFIPSERKKKKIVTFLWKMSSMPICQQVFGGMWQMCLYSCACVFMQLPRGDLKPLAPDAQESFYLCCLRREVDGGKETEGRWEDRAISRFSSPFATVRCNRACDRVCVYAHLHTHVPLNGLSCVCLYNVLVTEQVQVREGVKD